MSEIEPEETIAIVGMAGRFPGARNLEELWENLRQGEEGISFFSAEELAAAGVSPQEMSAPGYVRAAPILEDIDAFDAGFFGFNRPDAEVTDPQHRLFMECAWEALEDAGCDPRRVDGQVGVYAGCSLSSYLFFNLRDTFTMSEGGFRSLIGNDKDYLASHTSYRLDLGGPSVGIQTACSTSLVAVHLASQSLLSGECAVALAGGATVKNFRKVGYHHQEGGLFSPDGHCRPFDADARGTLFGNGIGVVVLKTLADALEAGDRIYAVVRGSAVNNDGAHKVGYTAPGEDGQVRVVSEALDVAEVDPASIGYIETHGTGTILGDPIEVAALQRVFREVPAGDHCALGAVKSNLGHLESAAGIAGLIKAVLALHHGEIPPSLHYETPNPRIDFEAGPFYVNTELRPWPRAADPRRAGVSSFGIGGTNAHLVLEEAPAADAEAPAATPAPARAEILPISTRDPEALRTLAAAWRERLAGADAAARADLAAAAALRRGHHPHRLALVLPPQVDDPAALLDPFLEADGSDPGSDPEGVPGLAWARQPAERQPRVVFVFPGQGAQWLGMGRQLMAEEPVFRRALDECAAEIQRHAGWSLHEVLQATPETSRLDELDVVQPTLFALQVALARLWRSWGIEPAAVIGHSMGEAAAACIAGALTLDDAAKVICRRSRQALEVRGQGGMLLVELPLDEARQAIAGREDRVAIAACNSPRTTVLSGADDTLDSIAARLEERQVFCRRIQVDFASHSPQVDPLLPRLVELLADVRPRTGEVPMYSTVGEARPIDGADCDATYWRDNLRQPVMLVDAVRKARSDGHTIFLEISPHPVLLPSLADCLAEALPGSEENAQPVALASTRREDDERARLLDSLAVLYARGCEVDWQKVAPAGRPFVDLPRYPWQRQSYWLEEEEAETTAGGLATRDTGPRDHALLGAAVRSSLDPDTWLWQLEVSTRRFPYLEEHGVQDTVIVPAAFYLELAFAAARKVLGQDRPTVERMRLRQALFLPAGHRELVQLVVTPEGPGQLAFQIASCPLEGQAEDDVVWTRRADGLLARQSAEKEPPALDLEAARERLTEALEPETFYQQRQDAGFEYGPAYRGLVEIRGGAGEALARLHLPGSLTSEARSYRIHPALLDAVLQALAAAAPPAREGTIHLPVGFDRVRLLAEPRGELWAHARVALTPEEPPSGVTLYDTEGQPVLEVDGFVTARLEEGAEAIDRLDDWFFEIAWEPREPFPAAETSKPRRWLLLADDGETSKTLAAALEGRGDSVVTAHVGASFSRDDSGLVLPAKDPEAFRQMWREITAAEPVQGILYLWGLDASLETSLESPEDGEAATRRTTIGLLHLIQAVAGADASHAPPRLVVVTRGVFPLEGSAAAPASDQTLAAAVAQAPLWGLGAVAANEHPDLRCLNLDLGTEGPSDVEVTHLLGALDSQDEQRLLLRGDRVYQARLRRPTTGADEAAGSAEEPPREPAGDRPYRLRLPRPGDLHSLHLQALDGDASLAPEEILIEVGAAGLNFRDVLGALGLRPGQDESSVPLGGECSGVVVACGSEVARIRPELTPGTPVIAPALHAFGRYGLATARFAVVKPENLDFEQAGGLPIPYMTAYYALVELARLQPGETVLIHSAASGTGLAALQIARHLGARVLATAGNEEKRAFLREQGAELVMDSRRLGFVAEVRKATDNRGVDVVLNAQSGEAMTASLGLLAPYGRFLELGLRDIYQNRQVGLRAFRENVSYFAIDQARMMGERPELIQRLMQEMVALFADGHLAPPPVTPFPLSRAAEAFEAMTEARHLGRIVLVPDADPAATPVAPPRAGDAWQDAGESEGRELQIRADGTYLVTGGLGGLGLTFARWLATRGAGALVLLGRGAPSPEAAPVLEEIRSLGSELRTLAVDVGDAGALRDALGEIGDLPPLRGVLHAAGVLADATLERQDADSFRRVLRPKRDGAWNLHLATAESPLDFFVLFSSTVTLFGSPGQGNYAAANFALDVLARQRRAAGLPALAVNWGAFSEVGLWAAKDPEAARRQEEGLAAGGMSSLRPDDGLRALARLWNAERRGHTAAQMAVVPFSMSLWRQHDPLGSTAALFARLAEEADLGDGQQGGALRAELLEAPGAERQGLLERYLAEQIAGALRVGADTVPLDTPLGGLGLDSLMALGVRNRIEHELALPVPIVQFLQSPSLQDFASHLLQRMILEQVVVSPVETSAENDVDDEEWEVVSI